MGRYILRRLLQAIPLLFVISIIVFVLIMNMGDPLVSFAGRSGQVKGKDRERLIRQLGLDQPIYVQYLVWLVGNDWMKIDVDGDGIPDLNGTRMGVLRGDLGTSVVTRQPVIQMIMERLPNTLLLMVTAEIVIVAFALFLGITSALRQYSWYDNILTGLSFVGYSMPVPLLALGLVYIFGVYLKRSGLPYFPTVGMFEPSAGKTWEQILWHLVLPVATLSIISIAAYSRYIRSNMLEVIGQDYIRTARAKGLMDRTILFKHALKNAALPIVTLIGLDLGFLMAGALVTETIFSWPGMGRLFYDHAVKSDLPVLMGILMLISVSVVFFQLLTDITYTFLDPRIRYK
jgi:peptide/nickel transport system permease protein